MTGMTRDAAKRCNIAGITITSSATTTAVALPAVDSNTGSKLRYVRVNVDSQSTGFGAAYIKFGNTSSVAATTNDLLVSTNMGVEEFDVIGQSYVSCLWNGTAVKVNIVPIQN